MPTLTTRRWLPGALAAAALLGAACGGGDDSEEPARAMQVVMQDISFTPTALTASKGEHIRIEIENKGKLTHDFTIERIPVAGLHTQGGVSGDSHAHAEAENSLHLAISEARKGWLEFEPTEAGAYEFYCTVAGHREAGMRGTLTVQ